jgi:ELWxxDGT repeat protein
MDPVSRRPVVVLAFSGLLLAGCRGDQPPLTPSSPAAAEFPPGNPSSADPYLVRDIHPGPESSFGVPVLGVPSRSQFFALQGRVFFVADDGVHGQELWQTDGTAPGTQMVADICPGSCGSSPTWFTRRGDEVLFQARDVVHGQELWATDGTAGGTRMVLDLRPGPESGAPFMFAPLGERLLLQVFGPNSSLQLWSTDGTPEGTSLIREIAPRSQTVPSGLRRSTDGLVLFGTSDGATGHELWASDGTAAGTRLVRDICPGGCDGASRFPGALAGGRLFFGAQSTANAATELWSSDGTFSGTQSIGAPFFPEVPPVVFGDAVIFSGSASPGPRELWRTDGTRRGTYRLAAIAPGGFLEWRGLLFIAAGHDVWVMDSSERVGQIPAFAATGFVGHGNQVYLDGFSDAEGVELRQTDGTVEGTRIVADIRPGPEGSLPTPFDAISFGDRIFFPATDGRSGFELWAYRPAAR